MAKMEQLHNGDRLGDRYSVTAVLFATLRKTILSESICSKKVHICHACEGLRAKKLGFVPL